MRLKTIHNATELVDVIHQVGFLPLLDSGIGGYSAEELVDDDCRYVVYPDGGWDWPLWKWKGPVTTEGGVVYGKFFDKKAGFIAQEWWPDFMNWRRATHPAPAPGSIEETIVLTLREHGSLITRELRAACGFTGSNAPMKPEQNRVFPTPAERKASRPAGNLRSRFDGYVTRLQMSCHLVTQDFVYPRDRHGREYGWGWALLTTPEQLLGREACRCDRTPQESLERMMAHMAGILPRATEKQLTKLFK